MRSNRVLLSGFYVIPTFHRKDQWVARAASVKRPGQHAAVWPDARHDVADAP